jgi:O-antigen ligase
MLSLVAVLLWTRRRALALGCAAALVVLWAGLVLTLSQSSFTALLVGLTVLGGLRWGVGRAAALLAGFAAVAVVVVLAAPSAVGIEGSADNVSSGRWSLVRGGVELAADRPLAGWGAASFKNEYRARQSSSSDRASAASHTIPITVAAEQGLGGLALYLALVGTAIVTLLRGARRSIARAAVAAAFVALVVHTLLYAAFLEDPLAWALMALGVALVAPPPARRVRSSEPAVP